jgi:hypothetical protein
MYPSRWVTKSRFCPALAIITALEARKSTVHNADVSISSGLRNRSRDSLWSFRKGMKGALRPRGKAGVSSFRDEKEK